MDDTHYYSHMQPWSNYKLDKDKYQIKYKNNYLSITN